MKDKKSLTRGEETHDINISPLIDMVFILLIFFIVTTVFVEEPGVEVNKPFALSSEDLQKNVVLIAVTSNNQVVYGGENVGIANIRPIVRRLIQENKDMPVIIQADANANAGVVVRLVDEVKLAEAERIYLSTEKNA